MEKIPPNQRSMREVELRKKTISQVSELELNAMEQYLKKADEPIPSKL